VTGEALMGIALAFPVALNSFWPILSADPFKLFDQPPLGAWPGVAAFSALAVLLYRSAARVIRHSSSVTCEGQKSSITRITNDQ
jgi:hypothetical protein